MQDACPLDLPADAGASYNPAKYSFGRESWIPPDSLDSAVRPMDSTVAEPRRLAEMDRRRDSAEMRVREFLAPFRFDRMVGSGGFGEVWAGLQRSLARVIAIKRMRQDIVQRAKEDPHRLRALDYAFMQEALIAAALDHPNILPIHEMGRDENGLPLLAMKLVRGTVWEHQLWNERAGIGTPEFLERHLGILLSVCQAVAFAHSRGVVHRDVKPSQVMVGDFGEVLLMDWGLAFVYDESLACGPLTELLSTGLAATRETAMNPAGTPSYMAPEQTDRDCMRLGPATDVYLLGGTLYYILCGMPPHGAGDSTQAFLSARLGDVMRPSAKHPGIPIPEDLEYLAMDALRPDPGARVPSVQEFVSRIRSHLNGATQRRESERLAGEASRRFDESGESYDHLAECNALLQQAEQLWPANPRVRALRDRVLFRFARLALDNRDTRLARLLAANISSEQARRTVDNEAVGIEERQDRSGRQRRLLAVATVILLVAISVMAGRAARRAVDLVETQGELAASLDDAETFLNSTLLELHGGLEEIGRPDLLVRTAERARDYYGRLPDEGQAPSALYQRVLAFRTIGDIFGRAGRFGDALAAYGRSRGYARHLAGISPRNAMWVREYAMSLEKLAAVNERQAAYDEALASLVAASVQWRSLIEIEGDTGAPVALARNLVAQGRCMDRLGEGGEAARAWDEAADILAPGPPPSEESDAGEVCAAAVALLRLGRIEDARPFAEWLLQRRHADGEFLQLALKAGLIGGE